MNKNLEPPIPCGHSSLVFSVDDNNNKNKCRVGNHRRAQNVFLSKKIVILFLSSTAMMGLYYLIPMPASVRQHLKEAMPTSVNDNFETRFQLLFTLAHLPGVFLPFLAGVMQDQVGGLVSLLVFSSTCLVGQIISSAGVQYQSWTALIVGRFISGLGLESMFVANQGFLACWFEDRELGRALGVSSAASYVGYLLSFILGPLVANRWTVAVAFWLATMVQGIGFCAVLILFGLCRKDERMVFGAVAGREGDLSLEDQPAAIFRAGDESRVSPCTGTSHCDSLRCFPRCSSFGVSLWLLCICCLLQYGIIGPFVNSGSGYLLDHSLFVEPPKECSLVYPANCSWGYLAPPGGNPAVTASNESCDLGGGYSPVIPSSLNETFEGRRYEYNPLQKFDIDCGDTFWKNACTKDYCDKQARTTEKAGRLLSVPFIITVCTTFLFGRYAVDRAGLRAEMMLCAPTLIAIAHGLLTFYRKSAIVPMILLGFGVSMSVSSIWPSTPLLVTEEMAGAAFGLVTCVQNVGNSLFPLMVAAVYNNHGHQYVPSVGLFFLSNSFFAVLVAVALFVADRKTGGRLRRRDVRSWQIRRLKKTVVPAAEVLP